MEEQGMSRRHEGDDQVNQLSPPYSSLAGIHSYSASRLETSAQTSHAVAEA